MNSVQTKQTPGALASLLKAKGVHRPMASVVAQPIGTITERAITEVAATPAPAPEEPKAPATQDQTPAPDNRKVDSPEEKSRYDLLKAHHDKYVFETKSRFESQDAEISSLKAQLAQALTTSKMPRTKEELEEFAKSNPEAFDVMKAIAMSVFAEQDAEVANRQRQLEASLKEVKEKEAFAKLLAVHPDAKEIRDSAEFAEWFNAQPNAIKATLAKSDDVDAVIKLLTLYKVEVKGYNPKGQKKAAQEARVEASLDVGVKGGTQVDAGKKVWTKTEIDAVCSNYATWTKYKDEIDAARREGRVDLTK